MKKPLNKIFLFFVFFAASLSSSGASLSEYNFSQKQDTIRPLTGGNLLTQNYKSATVYYGSPSPTSGIVYPSNFNFSGIPIGFNFVFNGQTQNVFGINSRGYIVLGSNTINMLVTPATHPVSGISSANIVSALSGVLCGATGAKIRYAVLGSSPNRILAVQWENMARRYSMAVDSLNFQIRLHETSNKIEIVYNDLFIPKAGVDQTFEIGLKGTAANDFCNRKLVGNWNNTTWGFDKRNVCLLGKYNYPLAGTCFTFTPPQTQCAVLPLSGFASASAYAVSQVDTFSLLLDSIVLAINTGLEWQKSADNITWDTLTAAHSRLKVLSQDTTSFYRCKISCGANSTFSNTVKVTTLSNTQDYCTASFSRYPDAINIGNVSFSTINNGNATPPLSQQQFHAYSDFCNLPPADVSQGANYEMSLKEIFRNAYIKSGVMVFIDYNKDGNFNGTDESIFLGKTKSTVDGYIARSFIQIPDSAPLGITRMRVVLYDPNTQLPVESCDASFYGETEDYLVNVTPATPCTAVPDTVFTGSSVPDVCSNVPFRLFLSTPLSSGFTYKWYASADSLNWSLIPNAGKNYCLISQSQLSFYKCLINCQGNDSVYSIPVRVNVSPFYYCYCDARGNNPSGYQLENISISNLNNSSGTKIKLYSNYTSVSPAVLVTGGQYNFSATYKYENYSTLMNIKAFIDYDRNGVFGNNTNEVIAMGVLNSSNINIGTKSLITNIPGSAGIGITGMRVIFWENNNAPAGSPCGIFNHGEVEDYLVNIEAPDTCVFPVAAGTTISRDSTVCKGKEVYLTLTGVNYSPNYQYQWQTSSDSLSWTDVANANLFTTSIVQNVRTYYRCKVSCTDSFSFSVPITVPFTYFQYCYCASAAFPNDATDIGNIKIAGYNYGKDTLFVNPYGGNTYSDFTDSLPAIQLQRGGNYPMKIIAAKTLKSGYNTFAFVFIDFDNNGVFDTNESFNSGLFANVPSSALFQVLIPDSAHLGYTRMRIILVNGYSYHSSFLPCGNYNIYGETEDYLVNLIPSLPCQPLQHATILASETSVCEGTVVTINSTGISPQLTLKYAWQKSLDNTSWITILNSIATTVRDTVKASCYYRCIANCGSESDTTASVFVNMKQFYNCYCASSVANAGTVDIGNVKFAGQNIGADTLVNSNTNNQYTDYANLLLPIILQKGGYYPMVVMASRTVNFNYAPKANIYIDFNHNSIFDTNEKFYMGNFTNSFPCIGNTDILIPTGALLGLTRMRIVLNAYGYYPQGPPACGTNTYYGETEDYMVDIINALPCQPIPNGNLNSITPMPVCINQQVSLKYYNSYTSPLLKYTWQSSLDSLNWTTLTSGPVPIYTFTITTQKYFRCIVSCNPESDTSNVLKMVFNPFYNCYCESSVSNPTLADIGNIKIAGYNYGSDTLLSPLLSNSYSDFTDSLPPLVLQKGGHYPMTITSAQSTSFSCIPTAGVYIDFNHNGFFDNNERTIFTNFTTTFPFFGMNNVQVSATALLGITRMRVVLNGCGYYPQGPPACGTLANYGETEDYLVDIIAPLPCPVLAHGYLTTASTAICPTEKFKLVYQGNSNLAQSTFIWQTSTDTINWTMISGTFYEEYSNYLYNSAYFRCIITCGAGKDTTSALLLNPKPFSTCYCSSAAVDTNWVDIGNIQLGDFSNGSDTLLINPAAINNYTDYTTIGSPITVESSGFYFMLIKPAYTTSTIVNVRANVSVDFNHDGVFSPTETFFTDNFLNVFPFTGSLTVTIPSSAQLGTTRMRIVLTAGKDLSTNTSSCDFYLVGETEDYLVNIVSTSPACQPLTKGKIKLVQPYACGGNTNTFYYTGNAYHYNMFYTWQISSNGITWYPFTYTQSHVSGFNTNYFNTTNRWMRCIVSCNTFKDTSTVFSIPIGNNTQCYCSAWAPSPLNQDIGNVSLGTLNNGNPLPQLNNPAALNTYSNFKNLSPVELTQGFVYPLGVSQINRDAFHRSKVKAYLDYNANGYFDLNEEFFIGVTSDSSSTPGKVIGTISVPYNADTGITGMRIMLGEKIYKNTLFACGISTDAPWGDVEDYLVKIVPNTNCALPIAGQAVAPIDRYCYADSVYLRLENNIPVNGQSYQWQYSSDTVNWLNFGNKTSFPTRLFKIYSPTYFRCKVSCNNYEAVSAHTYVDLFPTSVCAYSCGYPGSMGGSECFWEDRITHVELRGTSLNNSDTNCYIRNNGYMYTYPDRGNTTATIGRGKSYKLFVTSSTTTNISVWVDYDHNSIFTSSEWVNVTDSSQAGIPDSVVLNVPLTAQIGKTRMRIRSRYAQNPNENNDACSYFFSGETEDYIVDVDLVSNMEDVFTENELTVEPNPASENITLSFSKSIAEDMKLKLMNAQGSLIYQENLKQVHGVFRKTMDVSKLAKGIYILQLQGNTKIVNKKVVVK